VAADPTATDARLPPELRVRESADADLDRIVEFFNRFGPPAQWTAPAAARHAESAAPEPNRLRLIVEDTSPAIVGVGAASDGGLFRAGDGSWRLNLRIDPAWRRRGIGVSLLRRLEAHARSKGAPRLITAVRGNEPDGARFAEHQGYRAFHERIDASLDVPTFDASAFADPDDTAGSAGIRLATYGELLAENAGDVERFQRRMLPAIWEIARDVPAPTPWPETPPPFEQAKRMFFEGPGIDPETSIIALRDGTIVGITVTAVKENGAAYTNFTGVARTERGKGIALAMKLRALRALKRRGVQLFSSTNDEQNAAMRGINRRLGYVPDAPTVMYEKKFT